MSQCRNYNKQNARFFRVGLQESCLLGFVLYAQLFPCFNVEASSESSEIGTQL